MFEPSAKVLAEHLGYTIQAIYKIKNNDKERYSELVKSYNDKNSTKNKRTVHLMLINIKGGVGKSALSNILASDLDNSIVLNLDLTRKFSDYSTATTIDYLDATEEYALSNIKELTDALSEDYNYIIYDTPGEITEEVIDAMDDIDLFIVPFSIADKEETKMAIETVQEYILETRTNNKTNILFVLNNFNDDNEIDEFHEEIDKLDLPNNIIKYKSKLKYTKAIPTMKKIKKDISQLSANNKIAYRMAKKRIKLFCDDVKEILKEMER